MLATGKEKSTLQRFALSLYIMYHLYYQQQINEDLPSSS